MKLATRLWLSGALLPVLVMAVVLLGADGLFHWALENSLDRALLAQAAVESVSLFDGPKREPHLHMSISPLVESVRPFAPLGVLFGPDGYEVMRYPPTNGKPTRERVLPGTPGAPPTLSTLHRGRLRERRLLVTVAAPSGAPYTLQLTAALTQFETAITTFHSLAIAALLVMALVLVLVHTLQGRTLRRRLFELSEHVEALRAGDLERKLAPEGSRDELSALRGVLDEATRALKAVHDARERLVADAAHELRTPLTLMRTSLDLALRRERSPEELKGALSDTRDEVDRLASLASRLLDLAGMAHADESAEPCNVVEIARDAMAVAHALAEERGLTLTLRGAALGLRNVRRHALRQAIDNLLSNAIKYARREIVVCLEAAQDRVVVRVRDDGPGIPATEREFVFEPFHRVRGSSQGAGLGLAIVREVAHLHRGRAYVEPTTIGAEVVLELLGEASAPK